MLQDINHKTLTRVATVISLHNQKDMGIIINDEISLPSGLKLKGCYAGFSSNIITVTPYDSTDSPTGKMYTIQAPYNIWVNDDARKAGKDPLMVKLLQFTMGPQCLMSGVYSVLYGEMSKAYTDVTNTDVLPSQSHDQPAQS